jgi:hypothetical protein
MRLISVLGVGVVVLVAGCGDSGDGSGSRAESKPTATPAEKEKAGALGPENAVFVAATDANLARYCVQTLRDGVPSAKLDQAVRRGTDNLITLARDNPDATYQSHSAGTRTMRQVLSDMASDVDSCDPQLAGKLDRAVDTLAGS